MKGAAEPIDGGAVGTMGRGIEGLGDMGLRMGGGAMKERTGGGNPIMLCCIVCGAICGTTCLLTGLYLSSSTIWGTEPFSKRMKRALGFSKRGELKGSTLSLACHFSSTHLGSLSQGAGIAGTDLPFTIIMLGIP